MRYGSFIRVNEILNSSHYPINSMQGYFALRDGTISHYFTSNFMGLRSTID